MDGGSTLWSDPSRWNPLVVPDSRDANAAFALDATGAIQIDGSFTINHARIVAANGGRTLTFTTPSANGFHSLSILGSFSKPNNTTNLNFENGAGGHHRLDVSIGRLDLATNGGTASFGRADGSRWLNRLSIRELVLGAGGSNTITVNLNVAHDYALGSITFNPGNNPKHLYLINHGVAGGTTHVRTATTTGITDTGAHGTIFGSRQASAAGGAHKAVLRLDIPADGAFFATTALVDGIGGTLALLKTGPGAQTFAGESSYTGGTTVKDGTFALHGPLSAAGDITIASGATFVALAPLSARDLHLGAGSILGFDLGAAARLVLAGDVIKTGDGPAAFSLDFRNTGVPGRAYGGLLAFAGTSHFPADTPVPFVNFGPRGLNGTLTFSQLTNGFTLGGRP